MKHKYVKDEPLPMKIIDAYFALHMATLLVGVLLYYMNYFYLTKLSAISYFSYMFDDLLVYAVSPIIPLLHAFAFGVAFVGLRKDIGIARFMAIVLLFIDVFAFPVGTAISLAMIIYLALPSTARFFTPIGKGTATYRVIGVALLAVALIGFIFTSGIASTVIPQSEEPMPMLSAIDKVTGIDTGSDENIDVIVELWSTSSTMQAVEMQNAVLQSIELAGGTIEGRVTRVVNAINTKVNSDNLLDIASNPNVKKIIKNEPIVKLMYMNDTAGLESHNNPNNVSWIGEIRKIWGNPQTTGNGIVIAVVDSGIDDSIEALQRDGKSIVIDKFTLYGDYVHWHGTAVASCIASQGTDMYPELKGVAPGVDLLNVEVFQSTGQANPFDIIKGWEWVAQWKVDHPDKFVICSNSLGVPSDVPGILDTGADNMVLRYGIPMVVASGNEAPKYHVCSPGMGRYVLTVGAVDQFGNLASFSCTGPVPGGLKKPDVCALGVDVPAFQPHDTFPPIKSVSGTSFSTPIVAGMMALLYEAHPQYGAQQLGDAIRTGAKHVGSGTMFNDEYGYGIADIYGASTAISAEKPSRLYIYMFALLPIIAIIIMFYPEIDKKLNLY